MHLPDNVPMLQLPPPAAPSDYQVAIANDPHNENMEAVDSVLADDRVYKEYISPTHAQ